MRCCDDEGRARIRNRSQRSVRALQGGKNRCRFRLGQTRCRRSHASYRRLPFCHSLAVVPIAPSSAIYYRTFCSSRVFHSSRSFLSSLDSTRLQPPNQTRAFSASHGSIPYRTLQPQETCSKDTHGDFQQLIPYNRDYRCCHTAIPSHRRGFSLRRLPSQTRTFRVAIIYTLFSQLRLLRWLFRRVPRRRDQDEAQAQSGDSRQANAQEWHLRCRCGVRRSVWRHSRHCSYESKLEACSSVATRWSIGSGAFHRAATSA